MTPKLVEIDLSWRNDCECPGIKEGVPYLCLIDGEYYAGTFSREWYGLNFDGVYDTGYQLDYEGWERVWRIVAPKKRRARRRAA